MCSLLKRKKKKQKKNPQHPSGNRWGQKIFRMRPKIVLYPLAAGRLLTTKCILPKHSQEQLCRGRDIIKGTFQMPLNCEVEAN